MLYTGLTFITSDKILTNLAWFTEHVNSLTAKIITTALTVCAHTVCSTEGYRFICNKKYAGDFKNNRKGSYRLFVVACNI